MSNSILPPRKRDWKSGDYQLGLFIRFPDGGQMEVTINAGMPDENAAALALLKLVTRKEDERRSSDARLDFVLIRLTPKE